MNEIGYKLKEIRQQKKMTRKEVAEKLSQMGFDISDKTLYGYEIGRTHANADLFMGLCQIYQIDDILSTFGFNNEEALVLNDDENELIIEYRKLDSFSQKAIKNTIQEKIEYNRLKAYADKLGY